MKRLLVISLSVACVLIFAVSAMADFKMGIMSYTDIGYFHQDSEAIGMTSDRTKAFVDEARHSRLYGKFSNENMGGYMELGMGSGGVVSTDVNFRKLYGWYKTGNVTFHAGHTESVGSARFNASQLLGFNENNHIIMLGYGNLYTRIAQVGVEWRQGPWYFQIAAGRPIDAFGLTGVEYPPTPRGDAALGIRTKNFWATLCATFAWTLTDDELAGADDQATAWVVDLPMDFKFGMISLRVAPHYGQNVGNLYGLMKNAGVIVDAQGRVEDTDVWGGYADLTIGGKPFLVHIIGGIENADNDTYATDKTTWALAVRGAYKVGANFTVSPEIGLYDNGDNVNTEADAGQEWLAGIQFQFIF